MWVPALGEGAAVSSVSMQGCASEQCVHAGVDRMLRVDEAVLAYDEAPVPVHPCPLPLGPMC